MPAADGAGGPPRSEPAGQRNDRIGQDSHRALEGTFALRCGDEHVERMLPRSVPLLLLALAPIAIRAPDPAASNPRSIVREAERAVENRETPALAARWRRALELHPANASALFAQATLERLTYRYPEASRDYELLRALPASTGGRFRAFSALGEAEMFFIRAREAEAGAASGAALDIARASRDSSAEVLALVNLGILRLRKASPEVALATFDSASRVLPERDLELRARIRCGRASVLARTAREEAVTEAKAGARLARAGGRPARRRQLSARRGQRLRTTRPALRRRSPARHRCHARAHARRPPRARDDSPVARLRGVRAAAARLRAAAARRGDRRG